MSIQNNNLTIKSLFNLISFSTSKTPTKPLLNLNQFFSQPLTIKNYTITKNTFSHLQTNQIPTYTLHYTHPKTLTNKYLKLSSNYPIQTIKN